MQNSQNSQGEPLLCSPIFKGLTRQATLFGVDYHYVVFSGMGVFLLFINLHSLSALLLMLPLHGVGWILCKIDPHIFSILAVKARIGIVRNKSIWRCQSYAPF